MKYEHLVGLPFVWGRQDCFELARRFYADNFDIQIRDYARPSDWDSDHIDLLRHAPLREGFELITNWAPQSLRPGDSFCMAIGSSNANHIAVYLGDNQFIHHLTNRNSTVEEFRDFWVSRITYILRHPGVPDLRVSKPETSISEILSERYHHSIG